MVSFSERYWLKNAHVPAALLPSSAIAAVSTPEGLVLVDIEIRNGAIAQILPGGTSFSELVEAIDLRQGIVFPCFVDMHTHLDKGHICSRAANPSGTFEAALEIVRLDREKYWEGEDVYRRMAFGLKCSYAHGTKAVRTHIDALGEQADISFGVVKALQAEWQDRITLQAVSLVPLEYFQTPEGEKLADRVAELNGALGGLAIMTDTLDQDLDRLFAMAIDRGLDLDFHCDESGDPNDITLRKVAAAALRHSFTGQIVCGHCCSLAVQPAAEVQKTLDLVAQAKIGVVSLPMCNLFLQDRNQQASQSFAQTLSGSASLKRSNTFPTATPRWRGVTLLHELNYTGIPVAVASDNCRDPFFGFGDHDMLEVFTQATRIAQLDAPYGGWCKSVTATPAALMKLPLGQIEVGSAADLVLFKARYFSELFARPQSDRTVLRNGRAIDTTLPDYAELDDLL
jgi:cytosine/creatinine deaminase